MRRGSSRAALSLLAIDVLYGDLSHDRLRHSAISIPPKKADHAEGSC